MNDNIEQEVKKTLHLLEQNSVFKLNPDFVEKVCSARIPRKSVSLDGINVCVIIMFLLLLMNIATTLKCFDNKSAVSNTDKNADAVLANEYYQGIYSSVY